MGHIQVNDEWLYKYMPVVDEAIIRELEAQTDDKYAFSKRFERRMRRLMWNERHAWQLTLSKVVGRVALFLLCVISSAFLFSVSVEGQRARFFETVKAIWEDSVVYKFFVNKDTNEFCIHEPKYIPEGYIETDRSESDVWFIVEYENISGDLITWDQRLALDGGSLMVDSDYDSQITREIRGSEVVFSLYEDGFVQAYYVRDAYMYLVTADQLSVEEICRMLESTME